MVFRSVCNWATHPPVGYPVCRVGQASRLTGGNDSVWAASAACVAGWLVPELTVVATTANARLPAVMADRTRNFVSCMADFHS